MIFIVDMNLRQRILEKSHLVEVKPLVRDYYAKSGIQYSDLNLNLLDKLRTFIQDEINKLLADENYPYMIKDLRVKDKIKKDKDGFYLRIDGSYFRNREGISFYKPNLYKIDVEFCASMSGCNQIPFIVGFVNWIDFVKSLSNK